MSNHRIHNQWTKPTTSNFTDGASFVHTPLEQAPRRELLPANPHVVLPDEALAAGPPHGDPVAPRRRDEAGDPAVARALALVAYDDAASQIRDVDGVRDVVVAGHVVLVLGRAHLGLLGADAAARELANVEQVGDQLLLQPAVPPVRGGRGRARRRAAPRVERPRPQDGPHERRRRQDQDPDPHRGGREVALPRAAPPEGAANAVLAGLLGVVVRPLLRCRGRLAADPRHPPVQRARHACCCGRISRAAPEPHGAPRHAGAPRTGTAAAKQPRSVLPSRCRCWSTERYCLLTIAMEKRIEAAAPNQVEID
jgi:hypothetical protein